MLAIKPSGEPHMKKTLISTTAFTSAIVIASITLISLIGLTGCGTLSTQKTSYSSMVSQAKALHADASKTGHAWKQWRMQSSYVEHYLEQAETAKEEGDNALALKAAKTALKIARAQIAQREDAIGLKATWEK